MNFFFVPLQHRISRRAVELRKRANRLDRVKAFCPGITGTAVRPVTLPLLLATGARSEVLAAGRTVLTEFSMSRITIRPGEADADPVFVTSFTASVTALEFRWTAGSCVRHYVKLASRKGVTARARGRRRMNTPRSSQGRST